MRGFIVRRQGENFRWNPRRRAVLRQKAWSVLPLILRTCRDEATGATCASLDSTGQVRRVRSPTRGLVFGDVLLSPGRCYRDRPAARKAGSIQIMAKTEKSFQLKILYGEGDPEVVASQAVSIQKAGHQVETAVGRKGIDEAVRRGGVGLGVPG